MQTHAGPLFTPRRGRRPIRHAPICYSETAPHHGAGKCEGARHSAPRDPEHDLGKIAFHPPSSTGRPGTSATTSIGM
eukprot:11174114-Lingulodinium_polyedra.AAC.1